MAEDSIFNEANKVKSQFIKFGKENDWFKGTLLGVRLVDDQFNPGEKNTIYEFRAHSGEFHELNEKKEVVETPIVIKSDEMWSVGGKTTIDNQMRNVKLGTIVGMKFVETKPSKTKGYNPAKIINVYVGGIDPNYMGEGVGDIDLANVKM